MKLKHLGIIADGNRRWAKERGVPKIEGHKKGFDVIQDLIEAAKEAGIEYVTFYVFSTENWGREKTEVDYIMKLLATRIMGYAKRMKKNNVKMIILGSKERVNKKLLSLIEEAEALTSQCTGMTACFCFNYGGKQEIADAAKAVVASGEEITPDSIDRHLYHPEVPDVDMVVRPSGEERISGFMLWRSAYAEFLFIKKYFPEMSKEDIPEIINNFEKRQRRFGR
ncbi:di-trans,poly-cis-decaprenylcistransferase [Candidatus Saccharibacteria bacterium]|nr:di-trans,poly-cis-decaprenylcistransferase [Candidatus Saccharibacteria bacterium]